MKTDLTKILSVSGRHGLYRYLAQARNGIVVESLEDGSRTSLDARSKVNSLADISIYTTDGEMKLQDVLTALKEALGGADIPSPKADGDELKALFAKAVPDYDEERFYVSHMRKVALWYEELARYASLDFMTDEEREAEEQDVDAQAPEEDVPAGSDEVNE